MATRHMIDINEVYLDFGTHASIEEGSCPVELVSYVEGLPWSDSPPCTSPVIAAFLRRFSDGMDDMDRQILKRFFLTDEGGKIIGTTLNAPAATRAVERRRAYLAADWASRTVVPRWLRMCGAEDEAAKLAELLPVVQRGQRECGVYSVVDDRERRKAVAPRRAREVRGEAEGRMGRLGRPGRRRCRGRLGR